MHPDRVVAALHVGDVLARLELLSKRNPRSFAEYTLAKRRAGCLVCKSIPEYLRKEIRDLVQTQRMGATVATALQWLAQEYGIKITRDQWRSHAHAGHQP